MTKYQLYKLLRYNQQLKDKRHPMFDRNRFMKFLAWFMFAYYAALMLLMGVMMPLGMRGQHTAAYHILDSGFFYILITDFWCRFALQETPAQQARDYSLLPIRRSFLMHTYLCRSMLSWGNLFWGFFLVPFGMIAVMPLLGFWAFVGWITGYWLLIVANSLMYQFVRALCMKHMMWFLVPLALHAGLVCLCTIPDTNVLRIPCIHFMNAFAHWNILPFLAIIAIIAFWYWANYRLQSGMVYNEVAKKEEVELKHATQFSFLNRYGALGEYLKMEIKLRMRNKQVRMSFFVGLGAMLMFAFIQYFSDVYDGSFMTSFICLYDYIILGMMTLITIMCYEGNYIDGLMARRESIYALLRAKYYFNALLVLIPFVILIPLMVLGKQSLWMNLGYMFFTLGVIYPLLFQMAVYNNNTIPLNQKITGKQGNTMQQIISMLVLFLPIGLEKAAVLLLGDPGGYILLIAMGFIGIATHHLWLQNIYQRFMLRRHANMEGFRVSRQN